MEGITDGEIVKTDKRGRRQTSRERRAALLEEFKRSGMSGAQFARWAGIVYSTFANWRQQQQREISQAEKGPSTAPALQWVEAVLKPGERDLSASSLLVIELGAGLRLTVNDRAQAELAAVLLRELRSGGKPC